MKEGQLPLPQGFLESVPQTPLSNMGGEPASFSDLNAPTETNSFQLQFKEMRPDIPYTLPARLIAPLPERKLEVDDENPYGSEFRGTGLDYDELDRQ